VWGR